MFGEVLRTILAVLSLTAPTVPSTRDNTASLQAQLDAAKDITLPALADGSCYRTRGLWVSRNDTVISSPDGACIEALGPGEARLSSPDGDPITGSAILVGPGILLALAPNDGAPAEAGPIEILGNRIEGNGTKETPPVRGGIVVEGGQADGKGHVTIAGNEIRGNAGFGLGGHPTTGTTMVIDAHGNVFAGNAAGRWGFVQTGRGSRLAK